MFFDQLSHFFQTIIKTKVLEAQKNLSSFPVDEALRELEKEKRKVKSHLKVKASKKVKNSNIELKTSLCAVKNE